MNQVAELVMTRPTAFDVCYVINPWMTPDRWQASKTSLLAQACTCWQQLYRQLRKDGVGIQLIESVAGLPDLVFPANAAIVLDRRVLLSRFFHPQRQREEPMFRRFFQRLYSSGAIDDVASMDKSVCQEGAGDCLWDRHRQLFWAGYGPRSSRAAAAVIAAYFGCEVQALQLVDPRFYHLDVAMAVLERGEVLYYPTAFSPQSQALIAERIPAAQRWEVPESEAMQFNINCICANGIIYTTPTSEALLRQLRDWGYRVQEFDLAPFLMAGGAAACLTLRLDYRRAQPDLAQADKGVMT